MTRKEYRAHYFNAVIMENHNQSYSPLLIEITLKYLGRNVMSAWELWGCVINDYGAVDYRRFTRLLSYICRYSNVLEGEEVPLEGDFLNGPDTGMVKSYFVDGPEIEPIIVER